MALITVLLILTTTSLLRNVKLQEPEWHFTGINIARDKETNQGPHTYRSNKCIINMDMVSGNAVDNNTNGDFCKDHCATSYGDNGAYWTVNLSRNYTLNGIRIYNRNNAQLWSRKNAFKIIGNPTSTTLHDEATANPHLYNNRIVNVPIYSNAAFNSVTIEIPKPGDEKAYLTLCEVEIYSVTVFNCSIIPNPPERSWNIKNGTLSTDADNGEVSSGSVIEFKCIENYQLNGATSLLCMSSGSYDQDAPTCTEIRCNAPSGITNGTYTQQLNKSYPVGSALTWTCETGYRSKQSKERVCTNTTEWSGEQPTCSWVTCHFPSITNGELKRRDGTTINSGPISNRVSLSVYCNEGYRPNIQTITCNIYGMWSNITKCEQVTCGSLGVLTGGYYSYEYNSGAVNDKVYFYGTIAIPVCNETLYKSGELTEKNLTCGQNGEWTVGNSGCVALCEQPQLPNGNYTRIGNSTESLYNIGESVVPHCDEGFQLDASGALLNASRTCQTGHTWVGPDFRCQKIRCNAPSGITNGTYTQQLNATYPVGAALTWTCETGYRSGQIKVRECTNTAEWSGEQPTCSWITCLFPGPITNGDLKGRNDTTINSGPISNRVSLSLSCDEGYRPNIQTITCNLDGQWNAISKCEQVTCDSLGRLTGGYYSYNSDAVNNTVYVYGTIAVPVCNETLYEAEESIEKNLTCGQNGEWTGGKSGCVVLCEHPLLSYGSYTGIDNSTNSVYMIGESIVSHCDEGFQLGTSGALSNASRTCHAGHTRDVPDFRCQTIHQIHQGAQGPNIVPAAVGGGVAGVVVLGAVAVVVVVVVVLRRRRSRNKSKQKSPSAVHSNENAFANVYEIVEEDLKRNAVEADPYYDFTTVRKMSSTGIRLADLASVVLASESSQERFTREYQNFPEGMVMPHQKALENKRKNRYRNLFAYDDSRVELKIWEETDTDYINACYIHGYNEPKAYIASQGPVKDILNDFWRMIWQTRCGKIVMLTNIYEEGKKKCEQYWPTAGSEIYGSITVKVVEKVAYSNFTIRTLTVNKAGEQQRRVQHFHFTSWPDRDVPFFCSAFVHFRQKIKSATSEMDGPVIVHCSAGVGRTGTFIAVDYLVDQAEELGFVDAVACVETLRRQRVSLVQTKKQYIFVHQALVEILVMKTSAVPTAKFQKSYHDLVTVDPVRGKRKINVEFEMLRGLSPKSNEKQNAETRGDKARNKCRYSNTMSAQDYMPSLSQPGLHLFGEFINATFLPMYKKDNALIITQSPLETTRDDFWKMVYHQNVHTVVMMNHVTELQASEIYWPGVNESITHVELSIDNVGTNNQNGHTIVALKLTKDQQERQIKLIQFGGWKPNSALPAVGDVLSALELVQDNQRKTGNHPIVVHCMDGLEKSGLFCVAAALLDRTRLEQDVAISQVIEEMRNRRENIIPSVEQFEFLHDVMLAFLDQFETYSNFTLPTTT